MPHENASDDRKVPYEIPQDLTASHETHQDSPRPRETTPDAQPSSVQIPEDRQISITGALSLAIDEGLNIGKSTLQRHAKRWHEAGEASPVKCVLVTTRWGKHYALDRETFLSWTLDELAQQERSDAPQDLSRSHETLQDSVRLHEAKHNGTPDRKTTQPAGPDTELASPDAANLPTKIEETKKELAFVRERALEERKFLRQQLDVKDRTIDALLERDRETNILLKGLQELIPRLMDMLRDKRPELQARTVKIEPQRTATVIDTEQESDGDERPDKRQLQAADVDNPPV